MQSYTYKSNYTTNFEYLKPASTNYQNLTLVYTHGFYSDNLGRKPQEIKSWCIQNGIGFFSYELIGHGSNKENLLNTDINIYKNQLFEIIENIVKEDIIIAGTSLGAWLSLLACEQYPKRIKGFLGLATAPDFLKRKMTKEGVYALEKYGKIDFPSEDFIYTITNQMYQSGLENLLLEKDKIEFNGKVRLVQGLSDTKLDYNTALEVANKITSNDVQVTFTKMGNHNLASDEDIKEIRKSLDDFLV